MFGEGVPTDDTSACVLSVPVFIVNFTTPISVGCFAKWVVNEGTCLNLGTFLSCTDKACVLVDKRVQKVDERRGDCVLFRVDSAVS